MYFMYANLNICVFNDFVRLISVCAKSNVCTFELENSKNQMHLVVLLFSFAPPEIPSPEMSSDYVASSSSHISDSIGSSCYDSPPSVPSTVPKGGSQGTSGGYEDGSVERGRATNQEGSDVWRFPDGSRHPRNI